MAKKPTKPQPDPIPEGDDDAISLSGQVTAGGLQFSRETLIGDVRDAILQDQKTSKNPLPWSNRSEAEQRRVVEHADTFAHKLVEGIMAIVAADGRKALTADRNTVTMNPKGQIVVKMLMAYTRDIWTDLGESAHILIVPTGSRNPYEGQRRTTDSHVNPDQGDMLDDDPDDDAGDDPDDGDAGDDAGDDAGEDGGNE